MKASPVSLVGTGGNMNIDFIYIDIADELRLIEAITSLVHALDAESGDAEP